MVINHVFFNDVFPNYREIKCTHYIKNVLLPLSLTCKKFYDIYEKISIKYITCDICHYRDINCRFCTLNGTVKCEHCCCIVCKLSLNLTGRYHKLGICDKCPGHNYSDEDYEGYDYFDEYYRDIPVIISPPTIKSNFPYIPFNQKLEWKHGNTYKIDNHLSYMPLDRKQEHKNINTSFNTKWEYRNINKFGDFERQQDPIIIQLNVKFKDTIDKSQIPAEEA